ncbi:MAG: glycerophosphodiester phosphodiesterase [Lachnospiraceae bacterium]|nr:glycerophosphodiester phosphodiesterase [Lachnospiraceae bacterium]
MTKQFDKSYFYHKNFAHRGLHNKEEGIPENSLAAFREAVKYGYGVELDVQLSSDGQVVVFHDDTVDRMCEATGRVDSFSYDELKEMKLLDTDERIPLFTEVLDVLSQGQGPVIVELKNGPNNGELCVKTYEILKGYKGVYCIESFNPLIVNWFRKNAPEVFRGQLATLKKNYSGQSPFVAGLLSNCSFSFINKPDFIAYENVERPARVHRLRKKGVMLIAWTSRTPDVDQEKNDAVIFENYRPDTAY